MQYPAISFRASLKKAYRYLVGVLPDEWAIQLAYLRSFGRMANLKNPRTLNEKINWRKLYQRDPRFTVFADKIAVKEKVAALIGEEYVIPTLWVGERPEDIPFDRLELPYVIKVNHSTGDVILVRSVSDIDRNAICASLRKQIAYRHGAWQREWAYLNIPPKILIERMLTPAASAVPEDYRFFVYHGRVHYIEANYGRFACDRELYCDRDWNKLPMMWGIAIVEQPVVRPENLGKMIRLAEKIGAGFDFVRVDLYQVPAGIFFGEATFYPDAGYGKITPLEWDFKLGEPWKINI